MRKHRLWVMALVCMLASCAFAKDAKYWIDLESPDTQCFHYGSVPTSAVQGDLDGDGVMDVAVATSLSAFTYPGKCFILWGGVAYQELLSIFDSVTVVAIEDINNDGLKDIICRNRVFFNQGNRRFREDDSKGYWPESKFADLNGDGILDCVTRTYWRNGSDNSLQFFNISTQYFVIVDMNSDGKLDVIGNKDHEYISLWYENSDKEHLFADAEIIDNVNVIPYRVIDYDYDGDDDLLVRREGIMGFMVNNNGLIPLLFMPLFEAIPEGYKSTSIMEDLDQDGDWDMFGYNSDQQRFFVVEQVGYRTLKYEFHWISDKVSLKYWGGYFLYQNAGKTYYYFQAVSSLGTGSLGGIYRTPLLVQKENAVSMNWELFQ